MTHRSATSANIADSGREIVYVDHPTDTWTKGHGFRRLGTKAEYTVLMRTLRRGAVWACPYRTEADREDVRQYVLRVSRGSDLKVSTQARGASGTLYAWRVTDDPETAFD